jgi:hypothetical protein
VTPEQQLARDLFLQEMWRPVREVPREEREQKRRDDRRTQREIEEAELSTGIPTRVDRTSTGCAETGGEESLSRPSECA